MCLAQTVAIILSQIATSALGGIVTFDPPVFTTETTNLPATISFSLTVTSERTLPDGIGPRPISSLEFSPSWDSGIYAISGSYDRNLPPETLLPPFGPRICGTYDCFFVYGMAFQHPVPTPLRVGEFTLGVPVGTPVGTYRVFVDTEFDQFSNLDLDESLVGEAFIHVVPEPATLTLLACGLAAMAISRRRSSLRS